MSIYVTSAHAEIEDAADMVWRHLAEHGPRSVTRLAKEVDAAHDLVMQAVGWLAREEKISIEEDSRGKVVYLH